MNFFRKSRPQDLFEGLWAETFHIVSLVWQATLSIHSEQSEESKSNLLNLLNNKSEKTVQLQEQLYEMRKEIVDTFYKNHPQPQIMNGLDFSKKQQIFKKI